jgi:hypothetical protein
MTSSFMRMLVGLGVALLSACGGGGGGGGEPSATVSFDTATLSATAFQNQKANTNASQDATSTVTATVSGTLSGVVYVVVRDTATGFAGSPIQVVQTAGGGYRATLKPNVALVAGSYTGNLEVHLCKDVLLAPAASPACAPACAGACPAGAPSRPEMLKPVSASTLVDALPLQRLDAGLARR